MLGMPMRRSRTCCLVRWTPGGWCSHTLYYSTVQYIIPFLKVMYLILIYQVYFLRQILYFSKKTPRSVYSTIHALKSDFRWRGGEGGKPKSDFWWRGGEGGSRPPLKKMTSFMNSPLASTSSLLFSECCCYSVVIYIFVKSGHNGAIDIWNNIHLSKHISKI